MKAHSKYEQSWQEAFEPAALTPNPTVWAGIEHALDTKPGNNKGWLPLLLVAASISLAMAFPFTIGDSGLPVEEINNFQASVQSQPGTHDTNELIILKDDNLENDKERITDVDGITTNNFIAANATNGDLLAENSLAVRDKEFSEEVLSASVDNIGEYSLSTLSIPYYLAALSQNVEVKQERPQLLAFNAGGGSGTSSTVNQGDMLNASASEFLDSSRGLSSLNSTSAGEGDRRATVVGFGLELPVGKRSALQFGVNYFKSSADGTSNRLSMADNNLEPLAYNDYVENDMSFTDIPFEYTVSDHYLSLPVVFKYPFLQRKLVIRGGLGTGVDILLNHAVKSEDYGRAGYSAGLVGISPLWISGVANMDIGYWIAPKYLLSFETGYRMGFGLGASNSNADNLQSNLTMGIKLNYQIK